MTTLLILAAAVAVPGAAGEATPNGALVQLPGTSGCVSEDGTGGRCADGVALTGATGVAVSPDGKNVYVASGLGSSNGLGDDAVAAFARNPATGAVAQLAGGAACVGGNGTSNVCSDGRALLYAHAIAISPDGRSVYVTSRFDGGAVAAFSREAATGEIRQLAGFAGCMSPGGLDSGCLQGPALRGASGIAVSPDGRHVYVAAAYSYRVAVLGRNQATGELSYLGESACFGPCSSVGPEAEHPEAVALSPDGRNVYVGSNIGIRALSRDATSGMIVQLPGSSGFVATPAGSVTVSSDGRNLYAAVAGAVTAFGRDPLTGGLTRLTGSEGCVSEAGVGGCANGAGLRFARSLSTDPEGENVYVATADGIAVFERTGTGGLRQFPPNLACFGSSGGGCASAVGFGDADTLVVSSDGRNVYVASDRTDSLAGFGRSVAGKPVCEKLDPVQVRAGQPVTVPLRCTDPNGDKLTLSIVDGPERGRVGAIDQTAAAVVYTPPAGFQGKDVFSFAASDGASSSAPVTVVLYVSATSRIADVLNPRVAIGPRGIANLRIAGLKNVVVRGTVALRAQTTGRLLGRASFTIPAGRTKAVPVRLNAAALRGLRKTRTLRATAVLTAHGPDGNTRIAREPVTLRAT